jgi:regulator of protease activity HflC (stomatin/prohibitin superfamily)
MFGVIIAIALIAGGFILSSVLKKEGISWYSFTPIIGIALALLILVFSCISYVSTGYTGIVTTFGKVEEDKTLDAGINFHLPWQKVITMDNREQRDTFQLEAFSKDIQQVDIQGSVNYNIDKSTAMRLYRDVGTDYVTILINPRIQEDVKIIVAKYTAENLIANRQAMADEIYNLLKSELAPKGINVISLAVENIDFTDVYEQTVEAKQVATQEKQRAQTQQEQQTMETEQAAKRKKIEAEAAAEVQRVQADAEAYAIKIKAEAEAEANKKLNASLTEELINYNKILKWNGQLPTITGGSTPIVNLQALTE